MIRIFIADTDFLAREGLKSIINNHPNLCLCGEASDTDELFKKLTQSKADILIFDLNIRTKLAVDILSVLKKNYPEIKRLILINNLSKSTIPANCHTENCISKNCDKDELLKSIISTFNKNRFKKETNEYIGSETTVKTRQHSPLTLRELEIIQLIAKGLKNKEIADLLNISQHTVSTHRKNIFKKLSLNSASELVVYAVQNGIILP
ncbi:MAG: response regulator transcription factor [Cytophagaceae bacterium]|nr:response regulator transcription factor [Cytophagaceae bacterium]MDW8455714.1 response regulator transcription factor [Cytophagaceae bacterium]